MGTLTKGAAQVNRTRRNLTKSAALVVGALAGLSATGGPASARHWHGGGGGSWNCFLRGTRIRTERGYRKIETLAVGDRVVTRFGGVSAIKAIGRHAIRRDAVDGRWPAEARPVRIRPSALDEGVPARDLYLTPTHALFLDEVLVPVGDLVNGESIVVEDVSDRGRLDYFNIELDGHDVIDAEGAACETLRGPAATGTGGVRGGASKTPCAPVLSFDGGRNELKSRLRSAAAVVVDRRRPLDVIRDRLEERGLALAA
ncbi:Hint domain-containing protein [Reyranella sp.]|uniref:Hint domain-containing protein n=1 Tax=Reyranella sp. TaxID=1929291 RepID=UPI003BAD08AB